MTASGKSCSLPSKEYNDIIASSSLTESTSRPSHSKAVEGPQQTTWNSKGSVTFYGRGTRDMLGLLSSALFLLSTASKLKQPTPFKARHPISTRGSCRRQVVYIPSLRRGRFARFFCWRRIEVRGGVVFITPRGKASEGEGKTKDQEAKHIQVVNMQRQQQTQLRSKHN